MKVWPFVPKYEKTCQLSSKHHLTEKLACIYLCMSKKLNSYFSDVSCMASNFLNRYFVNVICICVYFFQDLSMVGIFFTSPHFIKFKDVSQIKVQPTTLFKANLVKQIWLISSSHIGLTGGVIYFALTMQLCYFGYTNFSLYSTLCKPLSAASVT